MNDNQPLRVSLEELALQEAPITVPGAAQPEPTQSPAATGAKSYGHVHAEPEAPVFAQQKASILLQGWVYLGLAGLLGALAGWAMAEPGFVDGAGRRWGNMILVPIIVAVMCIGFAVAESIVERSARKALIRAGLSLPLGIVLGFVLSALADVIYAIGLAICSGAGVQSFHNPAVWIARGLGWMVFGVAGGVVYGIIGQSMKKTGYGALGGAIGAAIGGMIFDPISFATHGGAASRAVGFGLLGLVTGISIGLVESALKDRWLYVTSGPLAGKQFILYKPQTVMGSAQTCDIYLFKDPEILPQHAVLELKGSKLYLSCSGGAYISGQAIHGTRVLENGNILQMGRYAFRYQEKQRS